MNIFILDQNPLKAAQMHHDKHIVKMVLELAQMLSTAHRVLDGEQYIDQSSGRKIKRWTLTDSREQVLYKAAHINHPSAVWIRGSFENYIWAFDHFIALCNEYTHRYGKVHATYTKLADLLKNTPNKMLEKSFPYDLTDFAQVMPDQYKCKFDSVLAYRSYYNGEKVSQPKYTNREIPYWLKG